MIFSEKIWKVPPNQKPRFIKNYKFMKKMFFLKKYENSKNVIIKSPKYFQCIRNVKLYKWASEWASNASKIIEKCIKAIFCLKWTTIAGSHRKCVRDLGVATKWMSMNLNFYFLKRQ